MIYVNVKVILTVDTTKLMSVLTVKESYMEEYMEEPGMEEPGEEPGEELGEEPGEEPGMEGPHINDIITLEHRISQLELERETTKKELQEENQMLKEKITQLEGEIRKLKKELADLRRNMVPKQRRLEEESAILYIAQAATAFQEAICKKVLPKTFNPPRGATIKDLLKYLTGKEAIPTDEDIDEAKERWEKLVTDLQWTGWNYAKKGMMKDLPGDLRAIFYLKEARNPIAHRDIEITTAKSLLKDIEKEIQEFKLVHIRKLILNMDEKMKKCGLSHEGIKTEEMPERKRPRMSVQPRNTRK